MLKDSFKQEAENKEQKTKSLKADLGSPLKIIFSAFLIFIFSQFLALLVVEVLMRLGPAAHADLDHSAAGQLGYILLAEGLAVWSVFWLLRRRKLSLNFIGYGRLPAWRDAGWAAAGFVVFYILLFLSTALVLVLVPNFDTNAAQDVGFNFISTPADKVIAFLALVLLPPIGEETLIRGYLFSGLRARLRFWPALLITSLLFGAAHLSTGVSGALWAAGIDTFILSAVLVVLRERTGALYAPIMVHSLNNLIAFFVHFHG